MFPAEQLGPVVLKAWRAVLRPPVALVPVGGITPDNLSTYAQAGASGFGLGPPCTSPARRPPKPASARANSSPPGNAPIPPRRPKHEDHQAHHLHRAAPVVLPEDRDRRRHRRLGRTRGGRPRAPVAAAVEELSDYLVGKDPRNIEDHWTVLYRGGFYRGGAIT